MRDRRGALIVGTCVLLAGLILGGCWWLTQHRLGGSPTISGADETATDVLSQDGVRPWAATLFTPEADLEQLLFGLQALVGAGVFGYAGWRLHRHRLRTETVAVAATSAAAGTTAHPPATSSEPGCD